MKIFTLLIILTALANSLWAQVCSDTIYGKVGDEVKAGLLLDLRPDDNGIIIVHGFFELSNPTVFFPDSISLQTPGRIHLKNKELWQHNDSLYEFNIILDETDDAVEIDAQLFGELLAGRDTSCNVDFFDIYVNNIKSDDFYVSVRINEYIFLNPYIRPSIILDFYPQPVTPGKETTIVYNIDKNSDIKIYLIDVSGKMRLIKDCGLIISGKHNFVFVPDYDISSGAYYIMIKTNNGNIFQKFIIIK